MMETQAIPVERVKSSRLPEVDFNNLPFGKTFSDHMLVAEYANGQWRSVRIQPYGPILLSPATSALHYGQSIFEGMKAHRTADGRIALFRPDKNFERFNRSAERMAMPVVPAEIFLDGLVELLRLDKAWIPDNEGSSLYIRPLMFASEPYIGVRTSGQYLFMHMVGPVGPYYAEPVSVMVTEKYARAVKGGVGYAKTAGNYGRTLYPVLHEAHAKGYKDILWLDGRENKYVEEIGTMNVFFVLDGKVVTPAIDGTFLEGVTRESVLTLARDLGYDTEERRISIDELVAAHESGRLTEMFGTGTAATITYISNFCFREKDHDLRPHGNPVAGRLKAALEDIKHNRTEDRHDWLRFVD